MQQLFDILIHKLSLINNSKTSSLSNEQKDERLNELIIEKKKQTLRILVQSRLQQNVNSKSIVQRMQLKDILTRSHQIMSICDGELPCIEKQDPLESIVQLYVSFFNRQSCSLRAQQINNIYKKRLCPKSLLPSTLINWLVEWVRKQFQQFLKTNIHSLYVNSRQIAGKAKNIIQQSEPKQNEGIGQKFLIIHKKASGLRSLKSSVLNCREDHALAVQQRRMDYKVHSLSPSQKELKVGSAASIDLNQSPQAAPINKEVFYYAYSEQITSLYRSLEDCIPDLELNFVRRLKRGGRRKEVRKRIKEVANNLIKQMPHIKQIMQRYHKAYVEYHYPHSKKISKNMSLKTIEKAESSVKTSQGNRQIAISESLIDERRKQIISSLSKKHRYSIQSQRQQTNSESNLLPSSTKRKQQSLENMKPDKKEHRKYELHKKNMQLSLELGHQSKTILVHGGKMSVELEIIQERVNNIKFKHRSKQMHSLTQKKSPKKMRFQSPSIELTEEQVAYSSLPITLDIHEVEHLRLPKIHRLK